MNFPNKLKMVLAKQQQQQQLQEKSLSSSNRQRCRLFSMSLLFFWLSTTGKKLPVNKNRADKQTNDITFHHDHKSFFITTFIF